MPQLHQNEGRFKYYHGKEKKSLESDKEMELKHIASLYM